MAARCASRSATTAIPEWWGTSASGAIASIRTRVGGPGGQRLAERGEQLLAEADRGDRPLVERVEPVGGMAGGGGEQVAGGGVHRATFERGARAVKRSARA